MPLEDELCDILKKSRTGQGLSVGEVARLTGLPGGDVTALERGDQPRDRAEIRALAKALGLRPEPLAQIAIEQWEPVAQHPPAWVEMIHGSINGYGVQGYVVHDAGEAVLVDTAYNAPAMIEFLSGHRLSLVGICLTHGHADHADGIEQILKFHPVPVYLGAEDIGLLSWQPPSAQLKTPVHGQTIAVGRLTLHCLLTPGHTPGGTSWTWDACEGASCRHMVYADSLTAVSAPGFKFGADPAVVATFKKSIAAVADGKNLQDVLAGIRAALAPGPPPG